MNWIAERLRQLVDRGGANDILDPAFVSAVNELANRLTSVTYYRLDKTKTPITVSVPVLIDQTIDQVPLVRDIFQVLRIPSLSQYLHILLNQARSKKRKIIDNVNQRKASDSKKIRQANHRNGGIYLTNKECDLIYKECIRYLRIWGEEEVASNYSLRAHLIKIEYVLELLLTNAHKKRRNHEWLCNVCYRHATYGSTCDYHRQKDPITSRAYKRAYRLYPAYKQKRDGERPPMNRVRELLQSIDNESRVMDLSWVNEMDAAVKDQMPAIYSRIRQVLHKCRQSQPMFVERKFFMGVIYALEDDSMAIYLDESPRKNIRNGKEVLGSLPLEHLMWLLRRAEMWFQTEQTARRHGRPQMKIDEAVLRKLNHSGKSQLEIAKILKRPQSAISAAMKRSGISPARSRGRPSGRLSTRAATRSL